MISRLIRIRNVPAVFSGLLAFAVPSIAASPGIEPAALELANTVSSKLGSAGTIHVIASHRIDPRIGVGAKIEKGPIEITVKRPNLFYAIQPAGESTREIAYDGTSLCLIQPGLQSYALEPLKAGSIEQFADLTDKRFGFRPPVAELLSKDVSAQLLLNVTSAHVMGMESVGWTRCQRLHFEQPGMTGDLWVGVKDKLPRRYLLTFTGIDGLPTWDIRFSRWQLNAPVNDQIFTKRPAPDFIKVRMVKNR